MTIRVKTCSRCRLSKPIRDYYPKPRDPGETLAYCKPCFNAYTTERFRRRKRQAVEYLGGRCADCGGVYPYYVFEFHHLDPARKEMGFNQLRRRSWEAVKREIDKCLLLCSNCHRIRHWREFDEEAEFHP
jgi:hypothetical protein